MRDLTIDICVLFAAAGSVQHYGQQKTDALALMKKMLGEDDWAFAFDVRIESQYREHFQFGHYAHSWLQLMRARGKSLRVTGLRYHEKRRVRSRTHRARLPKEDEKYVEVAVCTDCNHLATHNSTHFNHDACTILREIPVYVVDAKGACDL